MDLETNPSVEIENNENTYVLDTFLPNLRSLFLEQSETQKSKILDLQIVCDNHEIFHSSRLLLASASPNWKDILSDPDIDMINLPPEYGGYDQVAQFHVLLLSHDDDIRVEYFEKCHHLLEAFAVDFLQQSSSPIDILEGANSRKTTSNSWGKSVLSCVECGKEYVNEASFKNHVRLHQQKSSKKENIIPKHDYNPRTPSALGFRKRQSIKPKRFAENVELEDLLKEDIKVSLQKRRKTVMLICDQCQKTFSSKQTLDNHIRLHTNERNFPCPNCDKTFVCESVLKSHLKTHDPIQSSVVQCPHCAKPASSMGNLQRHIRSAHFEFSDKKQYICRTEHCGKTFKDPSALRIHEKIHTGERPFECTHSGCQKKFMTNAQLKIHLRIHTGEKPYACDQCEKKCVTKAQLRSHKLHRHIGVTYEKNNLCPTCGKGYVKPHDLNVHMRAHLAEAPFHCQICNKTFRAERNLQKHMKTHLISTETVYNCESCEKSFKSIALFRNHQKTSEICRPREEIEDSTEQFQTIVVQDDSTYYQLVDGQVLKPGETEGIFIIQNQIVQDSK